VKSLADQLLDAAIGTGNGRRSDSAQDVLDVLAVVAGWKPVAIVGCGYDGTGFVDRVAEAATGAGLATAMGAPWMEEGDLARLPAWYVEPLQEAVGAARILFVGRDPVEGLPGRRLKGVEMARFLAYPVCCVEDYHRRRRTFHRLAVDAIRRQAGDDSQRLIRLARGQFVPTPRSDAEAKRLAAATRTVIAPLTSVAVCRPCEAGGDTPAGRLSEQYRQLVRAHRLEALASLLDPA
jgi:hypothetical protein